MSQEFFQDLLLQENKLPDEFIEYLHGFSTEAPESEIKSILEQDKYVLHLIKLVNITDSFSTIKSILDFSIISLQIMPALANTFLETLEFLKTLDKHIQDSSVDLGKKFKF